MRKIQQSGIVGLSNIFSEKYKSLKLHRPLNKYSKKQIKNYAIKNKLIWFEDRSNLELDFTRNKIRHFLYSNKLLNKINSERLNFSKTSQIKSLHQNFFIKILDNIFEIKAVKFHKLNKNLKFLVTQSFYYEHRYLIKKQIRDENIWNFLDILEAQIDKGKEKSVFSGKIRVFKKKICINLT